MLTRLEPWITEDSLKILDTYVNKDKAVLEFGSGGSTIWFADKCKSILSIEHDVEWYEAVSSYIEDNSIINVDYRFMPLPYYNVCDELNQDYDIIFIDGRYRRECLKRSFRLLKSKGMLILDNSERQHYHCAFDVIKNCTQINTFQKDSDKYGFTYPDWTTTIWTRND